MHKIHLELGSRGYDVNVGRGLISKANEYFNLDRRVLILTDDGVPKEYSETIAELCSSARIVTVKAGEGSKSLETFGSVLSEMVDFGMTRSDCCVAVGGGVIGDLCGFVAASYMRGIDFYNVPTTLLSQVDSSIGGKVAINLSGLKNLVGAFYQPKSVIIDPDVLRTLPARQISNGLAEALKMAMTFDKELFCLFEENDITEENIEAVIVRSLLIKKAVVEADEREGGLRKVLNFGHTFGHAVEAECEMKGFYHGECVAIGMTVACSDAVKDRLLPILKRLGLPTSWQGDLNKALDTVRHDKKCSGDTISAVFVEEIGSYLIKNMSISDFCDAVERRLSKQD